MLVDLNENEINFITAGFLIKIQSNPLADNHAIITQLTQSIAQKFAATTKPIEKPSAAGMAGLTPITTADADQLINNTDSQSISMQG